MDWPKKDPRNREPIKLDNVALSKIPNASFCPKKLKIFCSLMFTRKMFIKNIAIIKRNVLGSMLKRVSTTPPMSTELKINTRSPLVKTRGNNTLNLFVSNKAQVPYENKVNCF